MSETERDRIDSERTGELGNRRLTRRGPLALFWDLLFRWLRMSRQAAGGYYATLGVFIVGGVAVAFAAVLAFVGVAHLVTEGETQAFDESVMRWVAAHQWPVAFYAMREVTGLGTGIVVIAIVGVAAMFLSLTRHKYSAILLLVATIGGLVLNNLLKLAFDRPRPQIFSWGTHALSSSFPSGHAMSGAIVCLTIAYLGARLQQRRWARIVTIGFALALIALIAASRIYLGVHYPSDVIGGAVIGIAWASFCMAMLEVIQKFALRAAPARALREEMPATRERKG